MELTRKRKAELLKQYNSNVRPIAQGKLDRIKKDTAKFIFVSKNGECHCQACNATYKSDAHTVHKKPVKCPNCGKKLTAHHMWRGTNGLDFVEWTAIPQVLNEDEVMLRYVMSYGNPEMHAEEKARLVISKNQKINLTFEKRHGEWKYSSRNYFSNGMNQWALSRWFCVYARPYPVGFYSELRKLRGLGYFKELKEVAKDAAEKYCIHQVVGQIMERCEPYEKLYKIGLGDFCKTDFEKAGYKYKPIASLVDASQTEIVKMLKLNKSTLRIFKEYRDMRALQLLQNLPNITAEDFAKVYSSGMAADTLQYISSKTRLHKTVRYIDKYGINADEYKFYLENLTKLNYPLDKSTLYPKDFYKMDIKAAEEVGAATDTKAVKQRAMQSAKIRKLSDALRRTDLLKEYFRGANGLQIMMPDSVGALKAEGASLHCCLGGYGERIATGRTMIFFVREINNPQKPFVAFEYRDGRIVQCRADYNQNVKDTHILNFVNSFTETLSKIA